MINKLITLANHLDSFGHNKYADVVDRMIRNNLIIKTAISSGMLRGILEVANDITSPLMDDHPEIANWDHLLSTDFIMEVIPEADLIDYSSVLDELNEMCEEVDCSEEDFEELNELEESIETSITEGIKDWIVNNVDPTLQLVSSSHSGNTETGNTAWCQYKGQNGSFVINLEDPTDDCNELLKQRLLPAGQRVKVN